MNWPALNDRLCGILINFALEEGLVLFLKERTRREEMSDRRDIVDIMEIGNYLTIYLEEKTGSSKNSHVLLLGRLKDLWWKSRDAIEDEYGVDFEEWEKEIKSESTSVTTGSGYGDDMSINLLGKLHCIGKIDFLGVPEKIPHTWMKVFEASEEDVREVLKATCENKGFKVKIGTERWVPVGFEEKHLTDNILIIGSYGDFLSFAMRQILKISRLPKIAFGQRISVVFSDSNRIPICEFQRLVSNGFGFEYCSDEQILNAAISLNPPQIRLLSNFLIQARKEKEGGAKFKTLKRVIDKNKETYNGKYSEDLEEISTFLESKWDEDENLNNLMGKNKTSIVDVSEGGESKQIAFSKFLHAVMEEIENRKRNKAPLLEFLLCIEDIEDYVPSDSIEELDSDRAISRETFKKFVSHPDTERIGLLMSTRFPSRIDPLIYYLCPNRLFGEVFEKRELLKIEEVFGVEEVEIRKLRNVPRTRDERGILLNFPSRFPIDVVDGILTEGS